jgi:hypothetical protein
MLRVIFRIKYFIMFEVNQRLKAFRFSTKILNQKQKLIEFFQFVSRNKYHILFFKRIFPKTVRNALIN